jgi:hypothetical protein
MWSDTDDDELSLVSEVESSLEGVDNESSTVMKLPIFMTEYDVVACDDFLLDQGKWVRMMPDEIKRMNPRFVPS